MQSNFSFLADEFPVLSMLGRMAEESCFANPRASLKMQGLLCDALVREICRRNFLTLPPDAGELSRRIDWLESRDFLPAEMIALFREVEKAYRESLHWLFEPLAELVRYSVENTFRLCVAFYEFAVGPLLLPGSGLFDDDCCPKSPEYEERRNVQKELCDEAKAIVNRIDRAARFPDGWPNGKDIGPGGADAGPGKESMDEALSLYEEAAEGGSALAQYWLGFHYEVGTGGVPVDLPRAAEYYRKAAVQGFVFAEEALARLFITGKGVPRDVPRAIAILVPLVDAEGGMGSTAARYLASLYYFGRDVPVNPERAYALFTRAARDGDKISLFMLGQCHELGRGVPKNREKAVDFYRQAAEAGVKQAADRLEALNERA